MIESFSSEIFERVEWNDAVFSFCVACHFDE